MLRIWLFKYTWLTLEFLKIGKVEKSHFVNIVLNSYSPLFPFLQNIILSKKGTFHFCKKFSEVSEVSVILGNSWGMKVKGIVKDSQIYKRWILNTKYTVPFLTGVVHFQSSGREALLHLTSGQRITCDQVFDQGQIAKKKKKNKKGNF